MVQEEQPVVVQKQRQVVIEPEQETVIREYVKKKPLASVNLLGLELKLGNPVPDTVDSTIRDTLAGAWQLPQRLLLVLATDRVTRLGEPS